MAGASRPMARLTRQQQRTLLKILESLVDDDAPR